MRLYPQSLKNALMITLCLTVAAGCILVSFFAAQRYAVSLENTLTVQGESLGKSMASQLADFVLINDITSIQKYIERQQQHYSLEYSFILHNDAVLAHTFEQGIPEALIPFNMPKDGVSCSLQQLTFRQKGGVYLDVACPIFDGAGGVVRLGISEEPVRNQVMQLWLETGGVTIAVLLLSMLIVSALLRNLTGPLEALTTAFGQVGQTNATAPSGSNMPLPLASTDATLPGQAEVATLAKAFNSMSQRLEAETRQVARAHAQLQMCNDIVSNLASRVTVQDVGTYMLERCREILHCSDLALILGGAQLKYCWSISSSGVSCIEEPELVLKVQQWLGSNEEMAEFLKPPLLPARFAAAAAQRCFPLSYNEYDCGMLVSLCTAQCHCDKGEISVVKLVLTQAAGSVYRAIVNEEERLQLQQRFVTSDIFQGIVGQDPAMRLLFQRIEQVATSDATVLLQSESGTGKELVARALHNLSHRAGQPFVVINCAAYPDTLLESELFGHEKGAFTGAEKQKIGRFEQAHGGTVFLDEIGEISPSAQVKLLRVLQSRSFERVGGMQSIQVNVRIVAATSRELLEEIKAGRFREDLYYRLDVVSMALPPLRERPADIPLLARHFLAKSCTALGKTAPTLTPRALRVLMEYPWPGNVRELENVLEQACVLTQGDSIDAECLPERLHMQKSVNLYTHRGDFERDIIQQALQRAAGNKKEAAAALGMSRTTLYARMKRYGINSA